MLKFLTNKLKNHTINDEASLYVNLPNHYQYKDNEEHDSGTESDDEINLDELEEIVMENEILDRSSASTTSPGPTICSVPSPYFLDSALASDSDINNDHHSSEEELEVINSSPKAPVQSRNASRCGNASVNLRSASVNALPEKRKWSEINLTNLGSVGKLNGLCLTPGTRIDQSSGSSDDEVQGFLAANMGTPVKFRTSPPLDVVKPGKSLSPPPKLFHYEVSSRKRHRHMHKPHHLQRPCLDFEKMQQNLASMRWVPLASLCAFMVMFSVGWGPVAWMMLGELFSTKIKGVASSFACATNWTATFLVTKYFPDMVLSFGQDVTFWIFAVVNALGVAFVYFGVPETKGKTLDDIQKGLSGAENKGFVQET